ncbi:tyrosine-type recombinase/integrase [Thermodesulfobacteriota bacterium]
MKQASDHLKPIITCGYYTGMRRGEILSLTWDKVNLEKRFIHLDAKITKDKEARDVPICNELYNILVALTPLIKIIINTNQLDMCI